ncbi:hypothetical protein BG006_003670, partial [Podila minutissima]
PKLRILIMIDDKWHVQQQILYIKAKHFIDVHLQLGMLNPWASETSLNILKAKITHIPRPDVTKWLKNLQVLDVQMMAQWIGLKEVQWMTQNWLKLQVIPGLHTDGDNLKAAEWLWKHSPMITVE